LSISLSLSVGYHRLFSHMSYKCHRAWHYIFAIVGTCTFHASPISWVYVHRAHHRYSDTSKDSHITNWSIVFGDRYRKIDETLKGITHLLKDPMHVFVHKYGLVFIITSLIVSFMLGINFFIFAYCLPVVFTTFVMLMFQIYSHDKNGVVDRPYLEFILPMSGEWTHRGHHSRPGDKFFGKFDLGAKVIKFIQING